jgi:hypothetical protein
MIFEYHARGQDAKNRSQCTRASYPTRWQFARGTTAQLVCPLRQGDRVKWNEGIDSSNSESDCPAVTHGTIVHKFLNVSSPRMIQAGALVELRMSYGSSERRERPDGEKSEERSQL